MMLDEMAGFIWYVLKEPIMAAVAVCAVILVMIVIATMFNFKFPTDTED